MNAVSDGANIPGEARTVHPKARRSLRREIVIVLMIKLVLIMGIKMAFFSHPLSQQETQVQLENMLAGSSAQMDESPAPTQSQSDHME